MEAFQKLVKFFTIFSSLFKYKVIKYESSRFGYQKISDISCFFTSIYSFSSSKYYFIIFSIVQFSAKNFLLVNCINCHNFWLRIIPRIFFQFSELSEKLKMISQRYVKGESEEISEKAQVSCVENLKRNLREFSFCGQR